MRQAMCAVLAQAARVRTKHQEVFRVPVKVLDDLCNACGGCTFICETGAIQLAGDTVVIDQETCKDCGECVKNCAPAALVQE